MSRMCITENKSRCNAVTPSLLTHFDMFCHQWPLNVERMVTEFKRHSGTLSKWKTLWFKSISSMHKHQNCDRFFRRIMEYHVGTLALDTATLIEEMICGHRAGHGFHRAAQFWPLSSIGNREIWRVGNTSWFVNVPVCLIYQVLSPKGKSYKR